MPWRTAQALVEVLDLIPAGAVRHAMSKHFMLDSGMVHEGDTYQLERHVDSILPGYRSVGVLADAVRDELAGSLRNQKVVDAWVSERVSAAAVHWLDDPDAVPDEYDVTNTCASCSSFCPMQIADGGVLGECAVNSAKLGQIRHTETCEDWTPRQPEDP